MPAAVAFLLSLALMAPLAVWTRQFVDEPYYVWSGTYMLDRLTARDFDPTPGADRHQDPGWNPHDRWFTSSPVAFRLIYAGAMKAASLPPPTRAFDFSQRDIPQPGADVPADTLLVLRLFSVLCAALGLAAPALRFGWLGLLVFPPLVIPYPDYLYAPAHVMAEGPLLLGLGLVMLSYGTPWLGLACAFAASSKLTALGFWPAMLFPGACGSSRRAQFIVPLSPLVAWVAFNPPSWFAGGPVYLVEMLLTRACQEAASSGAANGPFGVYVPPWYWLPVQYGLAVMVMLAVCHRARLCCLLRRSPA